jgi:phosphoglycerol transferase MdoB-like AlkP superfamily enzyme
MFRFFAHEGHEEIVPEPGFFDTLYGELFLNLLPFVVLAFIIFMMRKFWHVKQSVQLNFALVYLLGIGIFGYRYIPIAAIVGLAGGFGLSLSLMILSLNRK